jgi:hypothetical protein
MLLTEYVSELRNAVACRGRENLADEAYNATIDKFSRLLANGSGPDCRNQFRAFLHYMNTRYPRGTCGQLKEEKIASKVLQGLVTRHFQLSLLECHRNGSVCVSRYEWVLPKGRLSLLMPIQIRGLDRRDWLEANVPHPDPRRPDERRRVQAIIDEKAGSGQFVSIDTLTGHEFEAGSQYGDGCMSTFAASISVVGLAQAVADEKAANIDAQRDAIQSLGAVSLKRMILRIFTDLSDGCYHEMDIADEFLLAKATMSRFAGSRWDRANGGRIPDLWANTAQVLSRAEDFMEAAQDAGVWACVARTARGNERRKEETAPNEE